jgi:CubicO group peptidase (beta-lactamase class C family)
MVHGKALLHSQTRVHKLELFRKEKIMLSSKKFSLLIMIVFSSLASSNCAITQSATPVPSDVISNIDQYFDGLAEKQAFSGSVLISQGEITLLSTGYGFADVENRVANSPETRFHIGSVTKQFTAMGILILQSQDKVELNEPVCNYIPNCPRSWMKITIHQLLTHTSGLPDSWDFYTDKNKQDISYEPADIIAWFKDAPLQFKPGEKFSYSNTGYLLLGYLIEQVSGQSYEEFLHNLIFEPLEMVNTGLASEDTELAIGYSYNSFEAPYVNPSLAYSAGGLFSTIEDMYRWDQSFYTEKLVPQELLDQIFTAFIPTSYLPVAPSYDDVSYGYGWFVGNYLGHRVAGHGGTYSGFHALIEHYSDDEISIIILSNLESSDISVTTYSANMIFGKE